MNKKVRKAVIPAAGLGTRFLPWTKCLSKELLPIIDRPAIHYIVKELVDSGIEEIIFVLSPGRETVFDYFCESPELKRHLEESGKDDLLASLMEVYELFQSVQLTKAYQEEALGLGHSVLCAEEAVGDEAFCVLLPDDLMISQTPATLQMLNLYQEKGRSVVGVQSVPEDKVSAYGIVSPLKSQNQIHELSGMVEKPHPQEAPSHLGIIGRYLFEAEIFQCIRDTKAGKLGEIQLTDAMNALAQSRGFYALELEGTRLDVGNPQGWIEANNFFAKLKT